MSCAGFHVFRGESVCEECGLSEAWREAELAERTAPL